MPLESLEKKTIWRLKAGELVAVEAVDYGKSIYP